jgi:ADP-ribosylglycohydrolase
MKGAILGDIVGSGFESKHSGPSQPDFPLFGCMCGFTDDTVMTVAVMDALLSGVAALDEDGARDAYRRIFVDYGRRYRSAGYGFLFRNWIDSDGASVGNSYGNGAIMRVSPVGWYFDDLEEVERQAVRTTLASHEHEESRRAAKAVATTVLLARTKALPTRDELCRRVERTYGYDLSCGYEEMRRTHTFDVTCMGTVPFVFAAFRSCTDVEDAVRRCVAAGGDTDTNACIAAALAEAWFGGVPDALWSRARGYLTPDLGRVVDRFLEKVGA